MLKASLYFFCTVGILDILETKLSYNDFDLRFLKLTFFPQILFFPQGQKKALEINISSDLPTHAKHRTFP